MHHEKTHDEWIGFGVGASYPIGGILHMRILFATVILLMFANSTMAAEIPQYGFSAAENEFMAGQNEITARFTLGQPMIASERDGTLLEDTVARPYAEYEKAGYLIFSPDFEFGSKEAKLGMARNLPENVKLIIYSRSKSSLSARKIREDYEGIIDQDRLKIVHIPARGNSFWARDGVPVPVFRKEKSGGQTNQFTLVDAVYYHKFEPDADFGKLFLADLTAHGFYFEGGNFIANSKNECLIVNKTATKKIPDSVFLNHYGCEVLTRLPHVKGIGHADESVKFVSDDTVITDEPSYIPLLEEKGYNVVQIPRPQNQYETYVNSLIINGKVFVPIFNQSKDAEVLQIYRDLGYEAYGFDSRGLSNRGLGSLHCITMTYPDVPMDELLTSMGGMVIN